MLKSMFLLVILVLLPASHISAKQCPNTVNISVRLNDRTSPTIPELAKQNQREVCVKAGGSVYFLRNGKGTPNGFSMFLKDGSWSATSSNNRLEFNAPKVDSETEVIYGISMPDAETELDPIIIIVPDFN